MNTVDTTRKTKNASIDLVSWLAFSDEIIKIAAITVKPTTFGDVRKTVSREGTALMSRKPNFSKPHKEPTPPASNTDLAASSQAVMPPPMTISGH